MRPRGRGAHVEPDPALVGRSRRLLVVWAFLVYGLAVRAFAGGLLAPSQATDVEPRRIDLNRASIGELQVLPGIGPARAESIVLFRVRHGPFADLDALLRIDGVGPDLVAGIAPHVRLGLPPMATAER